MNIIMCRYGGPTSSVGNGHSIVERFNRTAALAAPSLSNVLA
jgi:hypothetical protein